ncbi:MAG: DUF4190 domain-containing protein [Candidatus Staskawiczbacteria bacterium]|nr:DUF4190 domain-containing protein [Candidatus Staskawiczbacteria bacterium]
MDQQNNLIRKSNIAIFSLGFSILGVTQTFVGWKLLPLFDPIWNGLIAIALGIIAVIQIKKKGLLGKNLAIAGIALGITSIVFYFLFLAFASAL